METPIDTNKIPLKEYSNYTWLLDPKIANWVGNMIQAASSESTYGKYCLEKPILVLKNQEAHNTRNIHFGYFRKSESDKSVSFGFFESFTGEYNNSFDTSDFRRYEVAMSGPWYTKEETEGNANYISNLLDFNQLSAARLISGFNDSDLQIMMDKVVMLKYQNGTNDLIETLK